MFFMIAFIVVSVYQLSFTIKTSIYDNRAEEYAAARIPSEMPELGSRVDTLKYQDSVDRLSRGYKRYYLDSLSNEVVYNLGIIKYTLKDCRRNEINLGLDLKGGMSVVLEIQVEDVIESLADHSKNQGFLDAVKLAKEKQKNSQADFVTLFGEAFEEIDPEATLAAIFAPADAFRDRIEWETDNATVLDILRSEVDAAVERTFNVIRTRIDQFGVAQPNISLQKSNGRIIVELPGVGDPSRVRKILQSTAQLGFWETYENEQVIDHFVNINKILQEKLGYAKDTTQADSSDFFEESSDDLNLTADDENPITTDADNDLFTSTNDTSSSDDTTGSDTGEFELFTGGDTSGTGDDLQDDDTYNPLWEVMQPAIVDDPTRGQVAQEGPVVAYVLEKDTHKVNKYLRYDEVRAELPNDLKLLWGAKSIGDDEEFFMLYALKKTIENKPSLGGDVITNAIPTFDEYGRPAVELRMNSEGAATWARLTREAVDPVEPPVRKRCIAIALDDRIYSAPRVQNEITGGVSQITGLEQDESVDLANVLKAGKLEVSARIIEEEVVGPSLGAESVRKGLLSLVSGFLLVLLFMIFYYSTSGIISNIALFLNLFFIIGALASMSAALTLPGMAGIVLTIGMAVDANVIIFERIREELTKGKGARLALTDGFRHSYSAIIDANITTLITAVILLFFGLGPVKGFATVLTIGIISSLFTAVLIARLIFDGQLSKDKKISFATNLTRNAFKSINVNFLDKRKISYAVSTIIIVIGLASIFTRNFELGVDFKGGRNYVVEFDQPVNTPPITQSLDEAFGGNTLVKTYGSNKQVQITTAFLIDSSGLEVDSVVEATLFGGLKQFFMNEPQYNKFRSDNIKSSIKVEATIADDIRKSAIWATIFGSLGIFLYILLRFRKWQFGLGALAAILHDVLIILSIFSLLNGVLPFSLEINQAFIAALLTIIGYSINDTVVVFDRIREFLALHPTTDLKTNVNGAINSTLSRTLITSATTLIVVLVLFLMGGEVIRGFSFALLIGIMVGTYSSVFIASPVMVDLISRNKKKG